MYNKLSIKPTRVKLELTNIESLKMQNQQTIVEDILDLPDEILLKIVSYLQLSDLVRLGCTCKKLNRFCYDETLYRRTNGRVMTLKSRHNLRNEWMNLIGKRRPNELNIVQCSGNLSISSIFDMFGRIGDQLIVRDLDIVLFIF